MRLLFILLALISTLSVNTGAADRRRAITTQIIYPEMRIPGCVISVDERGLQYTSTLTRWKNYGSAGSASDFIGAVNPPAVSTNLNGFPVVSFDGVNDYMTNTYPLINNAYTFAIIFKHERGVNNEIIMDGLNATQRTIILNGSGKFQVYSTGTAISVGITNTIFNSLIFTFNGFGSSYILNGALEQGVGGYSPGTSVSAGLTLGSRYTTIEAFGKCSIATILLYNRLLSTAEKIWLQNYLISKYGLTFASIERLEPWMYARDDWRLERQFAMPRWAGAFAM